MSSTHSFPLPRRWTRFHFEVPVRLVVHRPAFASSITGRGSELNEGGMCVFAGIELRLGDQVAVEFIPPHGQAPLRLWAIVRNRAGYYYGLEFLAENIGERDQVERFRASLREASTAERPNAERHN
jgi:hypothetical protein